VHLAEHKPRYKKQEQPRREAIEPEPKSRWPDRALSSMPQDGWRFHTSDNFSATPVLGGVVAASLVCLEV